MDKNRNFFDRVSMGFKSLGFVIIVMLLTLTAMVLCSHTMFGQTFPNMSAWQSLLATWLFAIAWESTTLITTVHVEKLKTPWIPNAMAIFSAIIIFCFLRVDAFFTGEITLAEFIRRSLVGSIAGMTNKIFTTLYDKISREREAEITAPSRVAELESKVAQLESALAHAESKLVQAESQLKKADSDLVQAEAFKRVYDEQRTCPYCARVMETPHSLTVHKGKCPQNPINLNKPVQVAPIKVNGHKRVFEGG